MTSFSALEYFRSLARIAARELRARGRTAPLPKERLVVEHWGLRPDLRRLARYLGVTGGTGIRAFHGPDALLPPLFPSTWEAALALELLSRPRAPALRGGVVHLESEQVWVRPLRVRDTARLRLELEHGEREPHGVRLRLASRIWNGAGQLGAEGYTLLLVRDRRDTPARPAAQARGATEARETQARETQARETDPLPEDAWAEVARWRLRSNLGRRYARVSGDYNPIHLSRLTALPFGFRRPLLHGFCTEALAVHALIERCCNGDPTAVRRVRVTFRRPLQLPATVRLLVAREAALLRFRLLGGDGGLYADGEFAGRE